MSQWKKLTDTRWVKENTALIVHEDGWYKVFLHQNPEQEIGRNKHLHYAKVLADSAIPLQVNAYAFLEDEDNRDGVGYFLMDRAEAKSLTDLFEYLQIEENHSLYSPEGARSIVEEFIRQEVER